MRPVRSMIIVGAALLASACTPAAVPALPAEQLGGEELFVSCAEVFKPGTPIDGAKAAVACHDVEGKARTPQYIRCTDGRSLFRIDDTMSETPGWGFTGKTFVESDDLEGDPDLADALRRCRR